MTTLRGSVIPGGRRLASLWPTVLVAAACLGVVLGDVAGPPVTVTALIGVLAVAAAARFSGRRRLVATALVLVAAGAWWGTLRADALERSLLATRLGETRRATAVVTGAPRASEFAIRARGELIRFGRTELRERVLLQLPPERAPPQGAVLELFARPEAPRGPETGFDEREWLGRQGVHVVVHGSHWRVVGRRGGIGGVADRVREQLAHGIAAGTQGRRQALVLGIVLGADGGLAPDVRDAFRASGLAHLLAVSGQNVAFVVIGTVAVLFVLGFSTLVGHAAAIAAVGGYVAAVGWEPSVIRAGVAGGLVSLAWLAARERDHWHFMAIGALVLLVWHPRSWQEPGFQLSFAAVASIFVLYGRLVTVAEGYPVPRRVAEVGALTVSASLATAPIAYLHFGTLPIWTVPANVAAEPAVPFLLWFALAAGVLEPVLPGATVVLSWLAGWCAAWISLCARSFAALPFAELESRGAVALIAVLLVACLLGRRMRGRDLRRALAVCLVLAVSVAAGRFALATPPSWEPPAGLRVTFLDVGQGDAILLEVAEGAVLVDQGPPEADVAGQLAAHGLRALSALVLTHPQLDHVGGAPDVIRRLDVATVVDSGLDAPSAERDDVLLEAARRGVAVVTARAGRRYRIGRLSLRVLWPDQPGPPGSDPNDSAIVLLASYGQFDVLLTADAESNVTRRLPLRPVEVLKVAHHGSEDPGLPDLLRTTRPAVAVISVGRGNDYDHPRNETLAALSAQDGLRVFRTDLDGAVAIESDGETFAVATG